AAARKFRNFLVRGVVLVIALGGVLAWFSRPLPPPRVLRTTQLTHDGVAKAAVLTDGARLYINEDKGPNQLLVQPSAACGESLIVPPPLSNVGLYDISPDRSQLLVGPIYYSSLKLLSELEFWVLPLPTGSPRRVSNIVAHWAAWSADGQRLVFAKGS